ncbi:MAG: hypothetical protein IJ538_01930 [Clostridia bacterium]|nr:hypothetical protein [Clostridia bacterium]
MERFFLASSGATALWIVVDVLLMLTAIGLFVWFYFMFIRKSSSKVEDDSVKKINSDTYVIEKSSNDSDSNPVEIKTNRVEHFSSQINEIYEPVKDKPATDVKVSDEPKEKTLKKEEVINFAPSPRKTKIKTTKKPKEQPKQKIENPTYDEARNFVDVIKSEQTTKRKRKTK